MIQKLNLKYTAGLLRLGCKSGYRINTNLLKSITELIEYSVEPIFS